MIEPPHQEEHETWLLSMIEGRRAEVASFTWSVPGLAIAGQAFLLSIVLDASASSTARVVASLAGVVAAAAATHLYGKQIHLFDLYEGVIESARQRLKLPGLQTDDLKARKFPPNTLYVQRGWAEPKWWQGPIVSYRSAMVWLLALVGFLVIDLFLLVYALWSVIVGDPGWL
jgi:hypothetical protein